MNVQLAILYRTEIMRLKYIVAALLLFPGFLPAADLFIYIKPVPSFQFHSQESFAQVIVTNQTGRPVSADIRVEIRLASGAVYAEYSSSPVMLVPGINDLGKQGIRPSFTRYYNNDLRLYEEKNLTLPSGDYAFCVRVGSAELGQEESLCNEFGLESLTPPVHLSPENRSEIEPNALIHFTWNPCMPSRKGIRYNLKIVEVLEGQTPEDAINRNPVFYGAGPLTMNLHAYRPGAQRPEYMKTYAWQVECLEDYGQPELRSEKTSSGVSEVWTFRIGPEAKEDTIWYARPKRVMDGSAVEIRNNKVYFSFYSEHVQSRLDYKISLTGRPVENTVARLVMDDGVVMDASMVLKGQNKYVLEFKDLYPEPGIYLLELTDQAGTRYYLKIQQK
jgi:hypothetical protein